MRLDFLQSLSVLDLTDHRGAMGAWYLSLLGARVVKLVMPDERAATDAQGNPYHSNKRIVALGEHPRDEALGWVSRADLILTCEPDGLLTRLHLTEDDLSQANPRIVCVTITPFGADGPRANQPHSDLTIASLGGPVSLQGGADRAPVRMSVDQVWRHTGMEATVASLIGVQQAKLHGQAQWIDVSAQASMTWTMLNAMEAYGIQGADFERRGSLGQNGTDFHHPTKDGYTVNHVSGRGMTALAPWLIEAGAAPESWRDFDFSTYDRKVAAGEPVPFSYQDLQAAMDALCAQYTKQDLLTEGLARGVTFAPVNTLADLLELEQLQARDYWQSKGGVRYPGGPFLVNGQRPSVNKTDGEEIPSQTAAAPSYGDAALPLAGIKVADFSWIGVGPITAKALADHGATVVRIESAGRPDGLRLQAPFKDGKYGINRSQFYGAFNTSKQSLALDLTQPEGIGIARRMVEWADIVIDSFRPGTMAKMGLGPDDIHALNPRAIVLATSLMGNSGPLSNMAGYGFHAAGIAGFTELVGWPDRGPDGPWIAYTDVIAPRFLTTALLAALMHRDLTGQGVAIEASQLEIALHFLTPELIATQTGGAMPSRNGNRAPGLAPQGVYPCSGEDAWVAISVASDEQWSTVKSLLGGPDWIHDESLMTLSGRMKRHDALDEVLGAWTGQFTAGEAERRLSAHGIPAGMVQRSSDLLRDPQYLHRNFYRWLEHPEMGQVPYAGHQYAIRGYRHGPRHAAPALGQHTDQVLKEHLGMSEDEISSARSAGALR